MTAGPAGGPGAGDRTDRPPGYPEVPAAPGGSSIPVIDLPIPQSTHEFGRRLGALLRAGDLVILSGALGAGKTALTKGIGDGMNVTGTVMSPTFVIARVHRPAAGHTGGSGGISLVHVDAYRLGGAAELDDLDLDTDLSSAAVVVEWGEGLAERLVPQYLRIDLVRHPDDRRTATVTGVGADWAQRLAGLLNG